MTQGDLLRYVAEALEALGIEYMIGGSQASTYYGEPRFTQDIDIVARLDAARVAALLERFPAPAFYASEEAAHEAVETRGQFNVIHPESGLKIDIFVAKETPYDRLSLQRRHQLPLLPGLYAYFARAEDVILYKMLYYREGGSEVHVRDILGMLKVSGGEIDPRYVAEWASRLGLAEIWASIVTRAAEGTGRAP
ncbi:MAG: hypothetical protein HYV93_11380 [Candidatus Rokubacteria bacterium]|nr:hypothetical protein [Candidatus Rokubacteria bacterium]